MRLFERLMAGRGRRAPEIEVVAPTAWPEDSLGDIEDEDFERAIAEGRRPGPIDDLSDAA